MSEIERDPDNGQFVSPSSVNGWVPPEDVGEITYGLDSVEASSGYTQNQPTADVSEDDPLREERIALKSLFPENSDEPVVDGITELSTIPAVLIDRETGERLPDNISMKPDEAAENLAAYESQLNSYVEGDDLANLVDVVDQARADLLKADPKAAEEYGLDAKEVAANAKQPEAVQPEANVEQPEIPGVDPEIARAVNNPQVRQFLESNMAQAESARQQYVTSLNTANQLGLSRLNELLPDIAQLPTMEQREAAFRALATTDPQRYLAASAELNRVAHVQAAQAEQHQYQAYQDQQWFAEYKKAEDAKFESATNFSAMSNADKAQITDEIKAMFAEAGLSPQEMGRLVQTDRTITSALGQKVLFEAVQYRVMQKAAKAFPTRQAPPVQKPGTPSSKSRSQQSMEALERRLAISGSEADGWALLQAKMRGRN
jgi:hypothetical protein